MIKTSRQLKDKIKNLTHGDSLKSQTLLRTYMMERFLERLAVSQYNSHFVLKGGMLVSSMVGIPISHTLSNDCYKYGTHSNSRQCSQRPDTLCNAI